MLTLKAPHFAVAKTNIQALPEPCVIGRKWAPFSGADRRVRPSYSYTTNILISNRDVVDGNYPAFPSGPVKIIQPKPVMHAALLRRVNRPLLARPHQWDFHSSQNQTMVAIPLHPKPA